MKIWGFTTVRDEGDIIESFVRYNMNILDGIVISDNCSKDNTLSILKKLKNEGYNIDILIDNNSSFEQTSRRNELLNYTIKKYKPDYVFPIDADEFICSSDKNNPRKVLEELDNKFLYKYKMKNYVLNGNEEETLFIPKKIENLRNEIKSEENGGYNYKCFIPKKIYSEDIILEIGSHSASFSNKKEMPTIVCEKLYLAHFPVRSKEQLINKVIVGRLNHSCFHDRQEGLGWHQYEILDEIIKNGTITKKTLINFSKYYSVLNKNTHIGSSYMPINLSFCKNINIKYSKKLNKTMILSNTIEVALDDINNLRKKIKEINDRNAIDKMEYEKNLKEIIKERDFYKNELQKILNSKTWKMKEKIINLLKILRIKK